ncbi:MAG TPA: 50S ribosomal protein L22 [Candidatus Magasanikbacteria bacterium]|nr:50S ribosomal protein L22 [Candidatus Magasanikbacteria bacterium]
METKAHLHNLRMSAKKARLVADAVRGKKVADAVRILSFTQKFAARPLLKLLRSAMANAHHNGGVAEDKVGELRIARIVADQGTVMKRMMPRAHGRAAPIRKPFCHVTLVLSDQYPKKKGAPERAVTEVKEDGAPKVAQRKGDNKKAKS